MGQGFRVNSNTYTRMSSNLSLDLCLLGFPADNDFIVGNVLFLKPSPRLLEKVISFLLTKTRGQDAIERLRDCYPASNSLQSKKLCVEFFKYIEELRNSGEIPRSVVLRKSMLDGNAGERLEEILGQWAQFLLMRDFSVSDHSNNNSVGENAPAFMNGATYACEQLIEDSAFSRLSEVRSRVQKIVSITHK